MAQERISPLEESIRDPLPRLKEQLIEEFEGEREDLIDQAAKHSLERYKSAKVREFVRSSPGDTLEGTSAAPPDPHRVSCFAPTRAKRLSRSEASTSSRERRQRSDHSAGRRVSS